MEASVEPAVAVAFNKAVDEHADALKNFAARMLGDQLLAEDIAQDTFLALYRNLHAVPVHAFKPWLFRVARNLCLDHLRRGKHRARLFRDLTTNDDQPMIPEDRVSHGPDQVAQQREMHKAVDQAIAALPAKFRETFLLCEVEGLSYEEAAASLGIPIKTVSTRLFRARNRFKAMIDKHLAPNA